MFLLFEHKYFSLEHAVHLKYCKPLHRSMRTGFFFLNVTFFDLSNTGNKSQLK